MENAIFPTPVGVFLMQLPTLLLNCYLPHACGGVPYLNLIFVAASESSPRLWGCSLIHCCQSPIG